MKKLRNLFLAIGAIVLISSCAPTNPKNTKKPADPVIVENITTEKPPIPLNASHIKPLSDAEVKGLQVYNSDEITLTKDEYHIGRVVEEGRLKITDTSSSYTKKIVRLTKGRPFAFKYYTDRGVKYIDSICVSFSKEDPTYQMWYGRNKQTGEFILDFNNGATLKRNGEIYKGYSSGYPNKLLFFLDQLKSSGNSSSKAEGDDVRN